MVFFKDFYIFNSQTFIESYFEPFLFQINQYGQDRIKKDLRELQDLNLEVKDRCILSEGDRANLTQKFYQPWSPEVIGYNIK